MKFVLRAFAFLFFFQTCWSTPQNSNIVSNNFRDFDENIYALSYQTFLEAKNIPEAFSLAQAAVHQRPGLMEWREKYAKTAEWIGQHEIALEQWEYIASAIPQEDHFKEVIRIAKMVHDDKAESMAWEGIAKIRTLKTLEWTSLAMSFENRGEPELAEKFLLNQIQNSPEDSLKFYLAELYLRMGKDEPAIKVYTSLSEKNIMTPAICLSLVKIYCRHGNFLKAGEIMNQTQIPNDYDNFEFWRYRAEVYNATQDYKNAFRAYEKIYLSKNYEELDLQNLLELSSGIDSSIGGRISLVGWKKFHEPDFFIYYLERCVNMNRMDSATMMLARLSQKSLSLFSNMPYFFDLCSRIHQFQGHPDLARREMIHAYELDPESEIYRSGVLWILIDQGRIDELAEFTRRWDSKSITSFILLLPIAISYKLQHRYQIALDYFEKMDQGELKNDLPFLLNYAEVFESIGDGMNMQKTFLRAKQSMIDSTNQKKFATSLDWREAKAKWNARFGNGDVAEKQMVSMLKQSNRDENAKQVVYEWKLAIGENSEDAMAELKLSPGSHLDVSNSSEGSLDNVKQILYEGNSGHQLLWQLYNNPLFMEQKFLLNGSVPFGPEVELEASLISRQLPRLSATLPVSVSTEEESGIILLKKNTGTSITEASVGYRQGRRWTSTTLHRNNLINLGVHQEWIFKQKSSLLLDYKYNTIPDENPLLELTGAKDVWAVETFITLPYLAALNLTGEDDFFYDHVRHFLGTGSMYRGDLSFHLFNAFSFGIESVYRHFNSGIAITKLNGSSYIADWLLDSDFPQSCFQSMGHIDVEHKTILGNFRINLFGASQFGATRFLNNYPIQAGFWEPSLGARGGFSIWPTRSQQISFSYDYMQGTLSNSGEETRIQSNYEYFFK